MTHRFGTIFGIVLVILISAVATLWVINHQTVSEPTQPNLVGVFNAPDINVEFSYDPVWKIEKATPPSPSDTTATLIYGFSAAHYQGKTAAELATAAAHGQADFSLQVDQYQGTAIPNLMAIVSQTLTSLAPTATPTAIAVAGHPAQEVMTATHQLAIGLSDTSRTYILIFTGAGTNQTLSASSQLILNTFHLLH